MKLWKLFIKDPIYWPDKSFFNHVYSQIIEQIRYSLNRRWWQSGLECVSNSSIRSLKDHGSIPAWGMIIYIDEFIWSQLHHYNSSPAIQPTNMQKYLIML